jgi:ribosomal protein S18 acetylase RimI-like enzyme
MAVHPGHRRMGLASAMIDTMLAAFQSGSEIRVTTFREGDPMGDAPRALYKSLGFREGELVEEFGYPCQCFVLHKP